MTIAFDTLKFAHRLEQVGVPQDQAEIRAELARDMIIADLATKGDLGEAVKELRTVMASREADLRTEIKLLEQRVTILLGAMLAGMAGVIVAGRSCCEGVASHQSACPD